MLFGFLWKWRGAPIFGDNMGPRCPFNHSQEKSWAPSRNYRPQCNALFSRVGRNWPQFQLLAYSLCGFMNMIRIGTRKKEILYQHSGRNIWEWCQKKPKIAALECNGVFDTFSRNWPCLSTLPPLIHVLLKNIGVTQRPRSNSQPFRRKQMRRWNASSEFRVWAWSKAIPKITVPSVSHWRDRYWPCFLSTS